MSNQDQAARALTFAQAYGAAKVSPWRANYPDMTVIIAKFTRNEIAYLLAVDADNHKTYLNVALYAGDEGPGTCLGAFSCISDDDLLHRTLDHLMYEYGESNENV